VLGGLAALVWDDALGGRQASHQSCPTARFPSHVVLSLGFRPGQINRQNPGPG
jgi:hypothetical protein